MKLGIIREGKNPPDSRVAMTPKQCKEAKETYGIDIKVQPAPGRCFPDEKYLDLGISVDEDMSDRDILLGVKEVPIAHLLENKTYFFFSHTIKEQAYNQKLLQAIVAKNIRLIDYEVLTNDAGKRLIAFGRFAGMVGAHNAIWTYGKRTGLYELPRMVDIEDYEAAKLVYQSLELPKMKIVLTGTGRVGGGAAEVLRDMGIMEVNPFEFLSSEYENAVFTQLRCENYVTPKDGSAFKLQNYYNHPDQFKSSFEPFTKVADVMINGIYWDNRAPAFFTKEEMQQSDFTIQVIADVTCDIAPISSIPSTLEASTIADPVFGYDPLSNSKVEPFKTEFVDVMSVDNLPNEMARDASSAFGEQFLGLILPELLKQDRSEIIHRATISEKGNLGSHFEYLRNYLEGKK